MKIPFVSKILIGAILAGTLAVQAQARTHSFGGSKSAVFGNGMAGSDYTVSARALADDSPFVNQAYIRLWGNHTVHLLGSSSPLTSFDCLVRSQAGAGTLTVLVRSCGFTVANTSLPIGVGTTQAVSRTLSTTFCTTRRTIWMSTIPVTFAGVAAGGASVNLAAGAGPLQADLTGGPKTWASSSATIGIAPGLTLAASSAKAKLMDATLRSNAGIGFQRGERRGAVFLDVGMLYGDLWYEIVGHKRQILSQWALPPRTYLVATLN